MYWNERSKVNCPCMGRLRACRSMGQEAEPQLASSRSAANAKSNTKRRRSLITMDGPFPCGGWRNERRASGARGTFDDRGALLAGGGAVGDGNLGGEPLHGQADHDRERRRLRRGSLVIA